MNLTSRVCFSLAMICSTAAAAVEIPVQVRWVGERPTSVSQVIPGGVEELEYNAAARSFVGNFTVNGAAPERRTLLISYGNFRHPIDIRLNRYLPKVVFTIEHSKRRSCTQRYVNEIDKPDTTLPDSLNRSIAAGQLLDIEDPNACDANLEFRSAQLRYRHNVRMNQLSSGLFLINKDIENGYRELAVRRGIPVSAELTRYTADEASLEAAQFVAARRDAQANGDFALAAEITSAMAERVESSDDIRSSYTRVGVTADVLAKDSAYLQSFTREPSVLNAR